MLTKKLIYNTSDLYLGFSFENGMLLPLLIHGVPSPDQLFGNTQYYVNLMDAENILWVNDAGVDMSNCGRLFCVRPFSNYVFDKKHILFIDVLKTFKNIIPKFLEEQYVVDKTFGILEQYKTWASEGKQTGEYYEEKLNIIHNLENFIEKYNLVSYDESDKSHKKQA